DPSVLVRALPPAGAPPHGQRVAAEGPAPGGGTLGATRGAALAAKRVILVAEEIQPRERLLSDPGLVLVPTLKVAAVVHEPFGAYPSPVQGSYRRAHDFYHRYHEESRTEDGTRAWLDRWVHGVKDWAGFLELLGADAQAAVRITSPRLSEPPDYGACAMKITAVEAICLAIPMKPLDPPSSWTGSTRKQIVVRIKTDAGLTGIGEAFAYGAPLAVCNAIEESLAPLIVGQDPLRIERLADLLQRGTMIWGRRGLGMFAISGIDIALWDLLGKARNAPVYELLGGARRLRLPVYASLMRYDSPKDVAAACTSFVKQGFRMLKLHQTDVDSVHAAREAVGPDVELMLDVNCPWTPAEALAMARALAPYRLFWFEEPVWPPEDYVGLAEVARETDIPIALGENESTLFGF